MKLRLTAIGSSREELKKELSSLKQSLLPIAGEYIYGYGEEPLEKVIGNLLRDRKLTLSIAESCTGGYLSHLVTSIPGSSEYFMGTMIP
ncbi:MAG: CinA family protein, partial [Cyclobacteriaceae bacterium]|nr:CinA family protein [Cyclobacteriaceae bacterium]